jgi:hypothetical protein
VDVDLALIAAPEVTLTAMGLPSAVVASAGMDVPSGAAPALVTDATLGARSERDAAHQAQQSPSGGEAAHGNVS